MHVLQRGLVDYVFYRYINIICDKMHINLKLNEIRSNSII